MKILWPSPSAFIYFSFIFDRFSVPNLDSSLFFCCFSCDGTKHDSRFRYNSHGWRRNALKILRHGVEIFSWSHGGRESRKSEKKTLIWHGEDELCRTIKKGFLREDAACLPPMWKLSPLRTPLSDGFVCEVAADLKRILRCRVDEIPSDSPLLESFSSRFPSDLTFHSVQTCQTRIRCSFTVEVTCQSPFAPPLPPTQLLKYLFSSCRTFFIKNCFFTVTTAKCSRVTFTFTSLDRAEQRLTLASRRLAAVRGALDVSRCNVASR